MILQPGILEGQLRQSDRFDDGLEGIFASICKIHSGFSCALIWSCVLALGGMVLAGAGAYSRIAGLAQSMECFRVVACGFPVWQKVNGTPTTERDGFKNL